MSRGLRYLVGVVLTVNFMAYWALPVGGMGMLYKYALVAVGRPLFNALDNVPALREFAATHIYAREQYSDFFLMSLLTTLSMAISLGTVLYTQLATGTLPWWMIYAYYCMWVGLGGRSMGCAYTMAHKEGHNVMLYQRGWRRWVGNWFENKMGVFYGNVPFNFQVRWGRGKGGGRRVSPGGRGHAWRSPMHGMLLRQTSHVHIHHKLDGGVGDTFYQWDLDRSSVTDFMLYLYRILMHMTGVSSLRYFKHTGRCGRGAGAAAGLRPREPSPAMTGAPAGTECTRSCARAACSTGSTCLRPSSSSPSRSLSSSSSTSSRSSA